MRKQVVRLWFLFTLLSYAAPQQAGIFDIPIWAVKAETGFAEKLELLTEEQIAIMKEVAEVLPTSIQQFILAPLLDLSLTAPLVFTRANAIPRSPSNIAPTHHSSHWPALYFCDPIISPDGSKILIPTRDGLEVRRREAGISIDDAVFLLAIPDEKSPNDLPSWSADGTKIMYRDHMYDIGHEPVRHFMEHKLTLKQYFFLNILAQHGAHDPIDPLHPHPALSSAELDEILNSFDPKVRQHLLNHPVLSRYPRNNNRNLIYCAAAVSIALLAYKYNVHEWIDDIVEKIKLKIGFDAVNEEEANPKESHEWPFAIADEQTTAIHTNRIGP